ncbi:MAG: CbtB-domain containing protein [Thiotrichales bacterium]|mgnify:CR=1 FL=1|jgi:cobalt transporter subunit CbtB|nr:CbtB-domain containing protein [Thiotrichales bacterium]MBT3613231.1 CbtB-domain containing protein [Thiotrichales bacterium]MBT3752705.1 CbtB-domain containing protein [Thiotrichales bacterium]MBT3837026.1 CbtB-domain containing protein [Thiotrichales bacterium]MBT4152533.1 CbtB-domain containing protein [Thiotrichales bacterium]
MNNTTAVASPVDATLEQSQFPAVVGAVLLGLTILFGVGFMQGQADIAHNAAHDTRHSFAFPCH